MMQTTTHALPEIFDSFSQARQDGFLAMKELKEQGRGVVGTFCTYTPTELFLAADLVPVGLCSTNDETIPEAEKTLPRNLCPLIKASYGYAVTQKCPYMYFADLVVGETTCDGKKKMYELLGALKEMHVMQLPQFQDRDASLRLWRSEIIRLRERLEQVFRVTITGDDIRRGIAMKNAERAKLKEFYSLSRRTQPPMTGLQQLQVLAGIQFRFSHEAKMRELDATIDKLASEYAAGHRPVEPTARRIVVTGCPMGNATEKVVKAIEESGGVVVAFENCTGAKQVDRLVRETGDPYDALAEYYLDIGCSVMYRNDNRLELLGRLCGEFAADGVVEMTLQACHTYAVETQVIRDFLRPRNIPYLAIETDYSSGDYEQIRTRAAAFIEML